MSRLPICTCGWAGGGTGVDCSWQKKITEQTILEGDSVKGGFENVFICRFPFELARICWNDLQQ